MKRFILLSMLLCVLCGCKAENTQLNQAMEIRSALLSAKECHFTAEITADYGTELHQFMVDCQGNSQGNLQFTVTQPETIADISGTVSDSGGSLKFDDTILYFPLMAEKQLNPVSAPWIFLKTLRSGYITSACREGTLLHLTINDSYEEDALRVDIWIEEDRPVQADVLFDGKRILSLKIAEYTLL